MPTNASFELIAAVMAASDALLRESQRLFRPHGLTAAQYNVMNLLADRQPGMSQRELGDALVVDRSNVTGLLDRMEKAGWVRREDDPADRRVYRISLTPSGRNLWARLHPLYLDVVGQVTRRFSAVQMRAATATLRGLETAAPKWQLPEGSSSRARTAHST
jgi:DNA-binding MarR family transcriptional regulator